MLEDIGTRLLAMTLGAGLIESSHGQAAGALADISSVRVVALRAVHLALEHGVMLGQGELGVLFEMAPKARSRISAGIENELATATYFNVFASRPVAGFATTLARHRAFDMQSR